MRSPRAALALCALAGCFSDGGPKTTGASGDSSSTSTSTATSSSTGEESPSSTSSGSIDCPLEQMRPWYVDGDGDGWGAGPVTVGCEVPAGAAMVAGDCDDTMMAVHPGAIELCNESVDDDCDGLRDEFSIMNTACGPCTLAEFGTATYWVCNQPGTYDVAEAWCQTRGAHLAYPGDDLELMFIRDAAVAVLGGMPAELRFWIGLRRTGQLWNSCDMNPEPGNWLTVTGAVAGYAQWRDGEPATLDCNPDCTAIEYADMACIRENCVDITEVATGRWDSRFCNSEGVGLVCEAPLPPPP